MKNTTEDDEINFEESETIMIIGDHQKVMIGDEEDMIIAGIIEGRSEIITEIKIWRIEERQLGEIQVHQLRRGVTGIVHEIIACKCKKE